MYPKRIDKANGISCPSNMFCDVISSISCPSVSEKGYNLNGSQIITTSFADDFNLCTTSRRTHQKLINDISSWTKSMKLKLKPIKCKSFSLVSGKPTALIFTLDNIDMQTIQSNPHKFLGSQITFSGK